jgi:GH15 family glucan-1,4-alpha-glucosidase
MKYKFLNIIFIFLALIRLTKSMEGITSHNFSDSTKINKSTKNLQGSLPISNGYSGAVYNIKKKEFANLFPHIYAQYSAKKQSRRLIASIKPVVTFNRNPVNIDTLITTSCGYIPGTGIVEHVMQGRDITLSLFGFCPYYINKPFWVFFLVLESNNINNYGLNFKIDRKSLQANIGKWSFISGQKRWLFTIISYNRNSKQDSYQDINNFKNNHPGFAALIKEIEWWNSWHENAPDPKINKKKNEKFYYQALTLIKMAQCREKGAAKGQIFASLEPGSSWTYLLDQSYATQALLNSGHTDEARESLQFVLNNKAGRYINYQWFDQNYGIKKDYLPSISKYYGNGTETTDTTTNGPNIELAGFGLLLSNIKNYVTSSGDMKFLRYYWEDIRFQIADVLINSIDETGLIRRDSGPWRIHLPGQHFTFTSICAYRGLIATNWMATKMDKQNYAHNCKLAAQSIRRNIESKLYIEDKNILKGTLEGKIPEQYLDGSIVDALNYFASPQDQISKAVLHTINQHLKFQQKPPAFRSNLLADTKKDNLFINLRMAIGYKKLRMTSEANQIMDKIISRSQNFGLALPEFYIDEKPGGKDPMIGRGAANIILYFNEKSGE